MKVSIMKVLAIKIIFIITIAHPKLISLKKKSIKKLDLIIKFKLNIIDIKIINFIIKKKRFIINKLNFNKQDNLLISLIILKKNKA